MTTAGALPPSSRETLVSEPAQDAMTCLPASVLPVRVTMSTRGFSVSARPSTEPLPLITLTTPAGSPAFGHKLGERQGANKGFRNWV